jgi:uncharacterized protein
MTSYKKTLPEPDMVSIHFWEAAKRHELHIQRCESCESYIFYPRAICPECLSSDLTWVKASGEGTVYSYTISRVLSDPGFADEIPYVVAIIELAEGPHMTSNIIGCQPESVRVGMPVVADFDDVTPEITLVKFRPV